MLPENAVYVGRAVKRYGLEASVLANPFAIGDRLPLPRRLASGRHKRHRGVISRADSIELYGRYLRNSIRPRPYCPYRIELARLRAIAAQGNLLLLCHCETWDGRGPAPGRCHAEVIREVLLAQG